jgi:hypothetical protein
MSRTSGSGGSSQRINSTWSPSTNEPGPTSAQRAQMFNAKKKAIQRRIQSKQAGNVKGPVNQLPRLKTPQSQPWTMTKWPST